MISGLVTIVIPHFNRSELLRQTLQSVARQTYEHWEVVIVDDGSSSDEFDCISRFADQRVRVLRRTGDVRGPSICRNQGAAASQGELLLFLDSDDLLAPWCLQQRVLAVESEPDATTVLAPVMIFLNQPGDLDVLWGKPDTSSPLEMFLNSDPAWHTSSPLWKRDVFLAVGGFNPQVMYGDDADLHIRALYAGIRFQCSADCLPDVFIRRTEHQRITSSDSPDLRRSRRVFLSEVSRVVKQQGTARHRLLWQGQFVAECERLMFGGSASSEDIQSVLTQWISDWPDSSLARTAYCLYLRLALPVGQYSRLTVRLLRKLCTQFMPGEWLLTPQHFCCHKTSGQLLTRIHSAFADFANRASTDA